MGSFSFLTMSYYNIVSTDVRLVGSSEKHLNILVQQSSPGANLVHNRLSLPAFRSCETDNTSIYRPYSYSKIC